MLIFSSVVKIFVITVMTVMTVMTNRDIYDIYFFPVNKGLSTPLKDVVDGVCL